MSDDNTRTDREQQSRVPLGWVLTNFQESVETISDKGKRIDQARYLKEGCAPVVDQGEAFIGGYTNDESKVYDGPLPIIVFGDHTRRVKYVDFPFVIGAQGVKLIRPRECWSPKFFSYLLPSLDIVDRGYSRHFQFIRKLEFPLPPLLEQQRIVNEIEKQLTRLEAAVEALKRSRANLKRYRASVLKAACEGRLVPTEAELARAEDRDYEPADVLLQCILTERRAKWEAATLGKTEANGNARKSDKWKAKYHEPVATNTSDRDKLPEGWCWATAEQCTSVITDGEHITPERADKGVFLLSARNVRDGKLSLDVVDFVPEAVYERIAKRLVIVPGDVLLSCSGSVGRSCVAPPNLKFTLVRSVAVLKPVLGIGHYLSAALRSSLLQAQITEKKTQTAQSNIFQGKIKTLVFPLPPLAEQQRIVGEVERRLSVIEELEASVEANLKRAERLRQSILKRAFEGKLVPQDPSDEPASVLLKRIRTERKATGERAVSRERGNRTKKKPT